MKTSNKIIALIFGLLILIPALVVATIIIKYRTGNFTRLDMKSNMITKSFPGIDTITLRNLGGLHIIPSDSLYVEATNHEYAAAVNFNVQGSALLIDTGNVNNAANDRRNSGKGYSKFSNTVWLYLPAHYTARIENCAVTLNLKSPAMEESVNLQLINSSVRDNNEDSSHTRFRKLNIFADKSLIEFSSLLQAGEMELDLKNNSRLNIDKSSIGNLLLNMDSTSTIQLNGQQLKSVIQKK